MTQLDYSGKIPDKTQRTGVSRRAALALGATGVAASASGLLASCSSSGGGSSSGGSGKKTTVAFKTNHAPDTVKVFKQLVDEFEGKNPSIHIDYSNFPTSAKTSYAAQVTTWAVGKSLPDVFYDRTFDVAQRASKGWLADLTPYIQNSNKLSKKNFWSAEADIMSYNGKLALRTCGGGGCDTPGR